MNTQGTPAAPGFLQQLMILLAAFVISSPVSARAAMNATASASESATQHMVILGASYVEEWQNPKLPGYTVTNKGIGGQESSDLRVRFDRDVIALKPAVVMIWGHYNDIVRASADKMAAAKQRAQDNYRWMTEQARQPTSMSSW
jgi:hypothetical protein